MQFIYERELLPTITIKGDNYKYLIKVRRFKIDDFVNVTDFKKIFSYKIKKVDKKEVILSRIEELNIDKKLKKFHIGWCKIDSKNVEKVLPSLNEIGVTKITFIDCDRSQGNFKIKMERLEKILINSSQQCGRLEQMEIDFCESLDKFLELYPEAVICDFGGEEIKDNQIEIVVVGCEGGFTERERKLFKKVISFNTSSVLRSETATISIASKVLL